MEVSEPILGPPSAKHGIEVQVETFNELFSRDNRLVIPEYQRPYVWGKTKAEELLTDLEEFFLKNASTKSYYLGSILLHHDKKESVYKVIDGQQRITTLLILKHVLTGSLEEEHNITFNSHLSIKYIKEAFKYFSAKRSLLQCLEEKGFLNRLQFTVIITPSADDAFTFFDTQNNRGVKLDATDFLKAYHLRAISSEHLQKDCAKQWEKADTKDPESKFLSFLFERMLWRARNWKGQNRLDFENKDLLLKTFQKETLKAKQSHVYPLYANNNNKLAISLEWSSDGTYLAVPSSTSNNQGASYPFSLRQPLYKGLNFFNYTERYKAVYELLFEDSTIDSPEVKKLRHFLNTVYTSDMSIYLREFMQLCLVMYYDVYGDERLLEAALHFDYMIGSARLQKSQIKKEAATLLLKSEVTHNLLDVIAHSYLPDEIFAFIEKQGSLRKAYKEIAKNIPLNQGVQGRYKARILEYFKDKNHSNKLEGRKSWM